LEFGPTNYDAFAERNLDNGKVLHWADLLKVEVDAELQAAYPDHFGAEVEAKFANGEVRRRRVLDSRGTPANPFTWAHLREKAESLTRRCDPPLALDRLQTTVADMNAMETIQPLLALLCVNVGTRR
jgi:2-methylcitrate dehydratase PrpD